MEDLVSAMEVLTVLHIPADIAFRILDSWKQWTSVSTQTPEPSTQYVHTSTLHGYFYAYIAFHKNYTHQIFPSELIVAALTCSNGAQFSEWPIWPDVTNTDMSRGPAIHCVSHHTKSCRQWDPWLCHHVLCTVSENLSMGHPSPGIELVQPTDELLHPAFNYWMTYPCVAPPQTSRFCDPLVSYSSQYTVKWVTGELPWHEHVVPTTATDETFTSKCWE
jgi:hypothetical protein